jgi:hypothetical protein
MPAKRLGLELFLSPQGGGPAISNRPTIRKAGKHSAGSTYAAAQGVEHKAQEGEGHSFESFYNHNIHF